MDLIEGVSIQEPSIEGLKHPTREDCYRHAGRICKYTKMAQTTGCSPIDLPDMFL